MKEVYERGMETWRGFGQFRADRHRCKRYVFGEQWDDIVMVDGRRMTEKEYIYEQGQNPMKNNILRRILRNVVGVYRSNYKVPSMSQYGIFNGSDEEKEEKNKKIKNIFKENRMDEITPRLLEEFLISGLSVVKISGLFDNPIYNGGEMRIYPVTPDNFFFHSDGYDPRGWDTDLVGEVHQVSFDNMMAHFCRDSHDYEMLEGIYASQKESGSPCRLVEVWHKTNEIYGMVHNKTKGSIARLPMDEARKMTCRSKDEFDIKSGRISGWRCDWYAADGTLLRHGDIRDRHPYVWKAYPFLDGEIHSYVSDIIDQQRYVNHLITLYDFIMKSSAKGVLLFPDESLPRGMSLQDVADEWSRFNGVIPYRAQPGVPLPTQVSGNAANIGITELLKIEMQMIEDISGVSPTLQGKLEGNTKSGTLFAQQNAAAMTSLLDVVRSFEEFVVDIARTIANR